MAQQGIGFGTGKTVYVSCHSGRAQKALTPAPRSSVTEAAGERDSLPLEKRSRKDARLLPKGKTPRPGLLEL